MPPLHHAVYTITPGLKDRAYAFAGRWTVCCWLDSNETPGADPYGRYDWLLACDATQVYRLDPGEPADDPFALLRQWHTEGDWLFGVLAYDLKNRIERLQSANPAIVDVPDLLFFRAGIVVGCRGQEVHIWCRDEPDRVWAELQCPPLVPKDTAQRAVPAPQPRISPQAYRDAVGAIRAHILDGDVYELNFCQAFETEACVSDPRTLFSQLNGLSPTPFAACFHAEDLWLLCASPERFVCRRGDRLISQPIKGTTRRGQDAAEDELLRERLSASVKNRAENVMITDLVRNDLSRVSVPGTVAVPELCGIYSFRTVTHMISTVSAVLRSERDWADVLRALFPMGSMTGAPKVMSMELIDRYESFRRGWYAGATGYIDPDGDMDFNVVIRSIVCDMSAGRMAFAVGGAVVYDSDPQEEYEESMLKAAAIFRVLSGEQI